jgi:NTP pyrophosphatase (non-canonical NTP hydrolase)
MVKAAVLAEECGEVARAALDQRPDHMETELIQVMAVAHAILEGMK